MKIDPIQSTTAIVARTRRSYRNSRKSPTVVRPFASATRRIAGPTENASTVDPIAADPTHHHAATPLRYPSAVAPTVDPAPILAASIVEKISPGPSRRPATKKSSVPRTRRPSQRPSAINASE